MLHRQSCNKVEALHHHYLYICIHLFPWYFTITPNLANLLRKLSRFSWPRSSYSLGQHLTSIIKLSIFQQANQDHFLRHLLFNTIHWLRPQKQIFKTCHVEGATILGCPCGPSSSISNPLPWNMFQSSKMLGRFTRPPSTNYRYWRTDQIATFDYR